MGLVCECERFLSFRPAVLSRPWPSLALLEGRRESKRQYCLNFQKSLLLRPKTKALRAVNKFSEQWRLLLSGSGKKSSG